MLIHHIKPEQVAQLERMFAKKTASGSEIPSWLEALRPTSTVPAVEPTDFQTTRPFAGAEHHGKNASLGFDGATGQGCGSGAFR
jgi:hypothetical protein